LTGRVIFDLILAEANMVDRSKFFPLSFFTFCACVTGTMLFIFEMLDLKQAIRKLEIDKAVLEERVRVLEGRK
jgi:hypothetical protein